MQNFIKRFMIKLMIIINFLFKQKNCQKIIIIYSKICNIKDKIKIETYFNKNKNKTNFTNLVQLKKKINIAVLHIWKLKRLI